MARRTSPSLLTRAVRALGLESEPAQVPAPTPAPRAPAPAPAPAAATPPPAEPEPPAGPRGMRIQRLRGRDLAEALERAARELGPDALVLSREPAPGGGVTVAFGVPGTRLAPPPPSNDPGLRDVRRLLQRSGASDELIARVVRAVERSGHQGAFAIDAAAEELGATLGVAPSPRVRQGAGRAHVLAFVGPTGVGKTTTLIKLASRLVRAGRRVALVAMDGGNLGGRAQLEAYGRLLQTPVSAARDGAGLAREVELSQHTDLVLVDTSGRSPRDAEALRGLARELGSSRDGATSGLDVYLTVAATAARAALDETLLGFSAARPTALVLTKFDETGQTAPVLEFAATAGLPVAFLCDGAQVSQHLHRTSADRVADLFLRGRMA